jgi:hypothetical protein
MAYSKAKQKSVDNCNPRINEAEMGKPCGTYAGDEKCIKYLVGQPLGKKRIFISDFSIS